MKTLLVINTKKYSVHKEMVAIFREQAERFGEVLVQDMADALPLHEIYYKIAGSGCDLLISFDCAGFELRTENDTLSYNNLGCRMAHILFRGIHEYREELRQQMNFSMFVFSMREEDVAAMRERHPNIPNVELMQRLECKEKTEEVIQQNRKMVEEWLAHLIKEAELDG